MAKLIAAFLTLLILNACQTTQVTKAFNSEERQGNFKDGLALGQQLFEDEPGTYAGSYISDLSCSCRIFLFTEAADETLGRYTDNPVFSAGTAEYSLEDLTRTRDLTKKLIETETTHLPTNSSVQVDEKLNFVSLLVNDENKIALQELTKIQPRLHPSVAILYPEDVGMVEVY